MKRSKNLEMFDLTEALGPFLRTLLFCQRPNALVATMYMMCIYIYIYGFASTSWFFTRGQTEKKIRNKKDGRGWGVMVQHA